MATVSTWKFTTPVFLLLLAVNNPPPLLINGLARQGVLLTTYHQTQTLTKDDI